jgi:hypothetical protein
MVAFTKFLIRAILVFGGVSLEGYDLYLTSLGKLTSNASLGFGLVGILVIGFGFLHAFFKQN